VPQCNSASGDGWAKFLRDHQTPSTMFELFFGDEVFGGMLSGINEITHLKPMLMSSILLISGYNNVPRCTIYWQQLSDVRIGH